MEFLVVAALLITVAAALLVPAMRESEASLAVSSARSGAFNAALLEHVDLTSMELVTQEDDGSYAIVPKVSVDGNPVAVSEEMKKAAALTMAATLSPSRGEDGNCATGVFAKYCLSG